MGLNEKMIDDMMDKMSSRDKEKMMKELMEKFFSEMTRESKQEMMEKMMKKFFSSMTAEEKEKTMKNMMPDMVETIMKEGPLGMMKMMMGGGPGRMMGMMAKHMCCEEDSEEKSEMPWDLIKKFMSSMGESVETAKFATPEIRGLFDEWVQQVEEEILQFVEKEGKADPEQIAKHFKLSVDSAIFFLTRLAKKRKVSFKQEKPHGMGDL
jgi:hypothetical protein